MILSRKKPALLRQPVQVSSDEVHLYYARPVLLGRVTRRDSRWVTDDGARHESTRQALDYLAARYERGEITEWVPPAPAPRTRRARVSSASKLAAPVPGGSLTSPGTSAMAPTVPATTATGLAPAASAGPATTPTASAVTVGGTDRRVGGGVYAGPERRGGAARDLLRDVDRATVEALLVRLVELEQAALLRGSPERASSTSPTLLPEQTKLK